eukprot:5930624-Pyramimonas_sp.AAC.1
MRSEGMGVPRAQQLVSDPSAPHARQCGAPSMIGVLWHGRAQRDGAVHFDMPVVTWNSMALFHH